uniref:anthocyanidin 3-O-glucosyltransferase n=1 Tax=Salix viminalis TaxID=40686 RepID=A0A6N2M727_SALVM
MAQGHIIPFLALAIELEQKRGRTITFASTPLNIKRIKPSLPPNSSIQLLEIPFRSSDHGLPPDCENTHDLPYHLILKLVEASRSLKPSFHKLVYDLVRKQHGRLPLCIISDSFFGCTACYYSIGMSLPHRNNESKEFVLADFPQASRIHVTQMSENLQGGHGAETLRKLVKDCMSIDGALFNSMGELDEAGLAFFQKTNKASGRGLLVHQWAPQMEILSHKSTSAFFSHCGWNSVLEGLSYGVPIIGWPMASEQFYNVKLLEEEIGGGLVKVKSEDIVANNSIADKEEFKGASVKAMDDFLNAAMLMREQAKTTP